MSLENKVNLFLGQNIGGIEENALFRLRQQASPHIRRPTRAKNVQT